MVPPFVYGLQSDGVTALGMVVEPWSSGPRPGGFGRDIALVGSR